MQKIKTLTNKEKHYLKYLLKKIKKINEKHWEMYGDSNNPILGCKLVDIDTAVETLLEDMFPGSDWF